MTSVDIERLRQIKTLPSLVKFLRDELDWPVEADEIDDLTFDYSPDELGLDSKHAAKIKEIKQLRPLDSKQPWGIFWVSFEKKRLPMVVLRRILGNLVIKTRASALKSDRPSWHLHDLLFISSYGEEEHRTISFAHFAEDPDTDELPVLRVLGWDDQNSIMHLDRVANRLHSHFRWPRDVRDIESWRKRWSEAFTDRYRQGIRSADELIPLLAELASGVRRRVRDVLDAETERGPMRRLFAAVQKLLIHDMDEDGVADMYAQTVAYGLLSARFSRPAGLTAQNLIQLTAVSNPFLENLLENLFRINRGKFQFDVDEVGINDVLALLRNTNIEAIKAAFSDQNPAEDPVIRFYEGFLKAYDPKQRVQRGVFFTPRPVVSYIVRSVHELLRTEFGLEDGLASTATWADMKQRFPDLTIPAGAKPEDPFVCILDPAVGTATFLFECIEVIERTIKDRWCRELGKKEWTNPEIVRRWREYVPKHLLPRLYGYELMMAPYAIAHLKLALKMGETGYQFHEGDRLHLYLTNSLEPPTPLADAKLANMFAALASEAQEVNAVKKHKRFSVVIGNPPYSIMSANLTVESRRLVERYRYVDGKRIAEKSAIVLERTLQDDYVKFFSIAEQAVLRSAAGILGMITNNGFLEAIGLRGLRSSLLDTFDLLHFLDLHGGTDKRDLCEDGTLDKNVFDITTGVAVSLLTRRPCPAGGKGEAHRCDLYGERDGKYKRLIGNTVGSLTWNHLSPRPDSYDFRVYDEMMRSEWDSFVSLSDLMPFSATGIETGKDSILTAFTRSELLARMKRFGDPHVADEKIRKEFDAESGCARKMADARRTILCDPRFNERIVQFLFTPFDIRYVFYRKDLLNVHSYQAACQLTEGPNICLMAMRQVAFGGDYTHTFVSRLVPNNRAFYSTRGKVSFFPLRVIASPGELLEHVAMEPRVNLDAAVLEGSVLSTFEPHDILHYVYALLWSRTYVTRYNSFLRAGFPKLPLHTTHTLLDSLRTIGADLVAIHLLQSDYPHASWNTPDSGNQSPLERAVTTFAGKGDSTVAAGYPRYNAGRVYINTSRWFEGVSNAVWTFNVGGYQVCEKWLKDRKGETLTEMDVDRYHLIVVAISETLRLVAGIDKAIASQGGWPKAFAT